MEIGFIVHLKSTIKISNQLCKDNLIFNDQRIYTNRTLTSNLPKHNEILITRKQENPIYGY